MSNGPVSCLPQQKWWGKPGRQMWSAGFGQGGLGWDLRLAGGLCTSYLIPTSLGLLQGKRRQCARHFQRPDGLAPRGHCPTAGSFHFVSRAWRPRWLQKAPRQPQSFHFNLHAHQGTQPWVHRSAGHSRLCFVNCLLGTFFT